IDSSRFRMTTRAVAPAVLRSKRGFFAGSPRERFFTQAASSLQSLGVVNACSQSCQTPASAISARSCGHKINAPTDGLRGSREGTLVMIRPGALCAALTPRNVDEVFSADLSGVDCVEVRLDYLTKPDDSITVGWDKLPVPVIATCRGKAQGGQFAGSIQDEIRILQYAV